MLPTATPILKVADLQARFGFRDVRTARAFMRRLPHFAVGRTLYTTEGHLAQWVARQTVGDLARPGARVDTLMQTAERIALGAIERMVNQGVFKVQPEALAS